MVDLDQSARTPGRDGYSADRGHVPVLVRLMVDADTPWVVELCKRKYSQHYDAVSTEAWFRSLVLPNPMKWLPIRTDHAFLIAMFSMDPWSPTQIICDIQFICADEGAMWEAVRLLRYSIDYAQKRGSTVWRLGVGWDNPTDLRPIARLVGAKEVHPICIVDFRSEVWAPLEQ